MSTVPVRVLVLAAAGDPGLARLVDPPAGVEFRVAHTPDEARQAAAAEPGVVLCASGAPPLLRAAWPALSGLRWIHSRSAGVDHLLFEELVAAPAVMTNSRGVFGAALGEFAAAAALYFAKDLRRMARSQAEGRWDPFDVRMVRGQRAVVVGLGDVGTAVARSLRGIGMGVTGVRRRALAAGCADEVVGLDELPRVLAACDVCVVATPLTADTRGLVDARALAHLPPRAVLVNVGRGAVVVEEALLDALRRGALRGAALDVFGEEPLPPGHPFWRMENVLLSPHCADRVAGWEGAAMEPFLENLRRFVAGQPLLHVVDKAAGY